ncbi:proS [Wigglesworthia glossinidia endosymbiont of Glossina brevipalpis]|uniref:Proline--tRNA ligase n=1 Tax=Wigglesworthia glossinidia brevipalpis TaxID=36870 RepID=SYP_WIGBR|nr:RecName: Full=Proline--tRNA ligase; AltName: Full=Prolyl-tRNA synthetase; Short=ProRS [Wigglesworthia glossinidia endosymbiont of Glossina brevipalpis]BAC24743.1 proS [Wigglesworthia glossinidia endosymbiont of Glossina brevipalpis]
MRTSQYYLATLKDSPSETEGISHRLMIRSGMIRKLSSGLYAWLPTGFRVLKKIENIIRHEMNKIGAIEILMPIIQPSLIWKNSGRYEEYGLELLKFYDRKKKQFVLAPTHEEVISKIILKEINFNKVFPINFYQIYSKFRDEARPRCGTMRSKEFVMKDSYSFHLNEKSLEKTYHIMQETYKKIFNRLNLDYFVIRAKTGKIGGFISHEFHAYYNKSDVLINSYKKIFDKNNIINKFKKKIEIKNLIEINAEDILLTSDLAKKFNIDIKQIIKILLVHSIEKNHPFIAIAIREDHEIDLQKVENLNQVKKPLKFANYYEINKYFKVKKSYLGPVNIKCLLIVDKEAHCIKNFVSGANINNKYFFNINWDRDVVSYLVYDLKLCRKKYNNKKNNNSIEIGHIFQLGDKYSKPLNYSLLKDYNKKKIFMGCYGIGISRLVSTYIEQNYDSNGIIWNEEIAPFKVAIIPININFSIKVKNFSEEIYYKLCNLKIDVLFYDNVERPGIMFSNIELIGIPHILIISDKNLKNSIIEYKNRITGDKLMINYKYIFDFLLQFNINFNF